jgi:hypothetical protein
LPTFIVFRRETVWRLDLPRLIQTVLKTLNHYELETTAEIDLSRDEDSITSLAVGQGKGKETLIYAGINSSEQDREKGKNEHFRIFGLGTSAGGKKSESATASKISELSRSALFNGGEKETYQRLVRLSKPFPGSPQLGATATAFGAKKEEVVLFDTIGSPSAAPKIRGRIQVEIEAEDVDVIQTGKDEYLFAYCTKYDIFVKTISSKTDSSDPKCITPAKAEHEVESKPVFRSLRFLSPDFLLMLTNLHGQKGAVIRVLRLPGTDSGKITEAGRIKLPAQVRQATGLAVCNLLPRLSPSDEQGSTQFLIAVAGHNMSISLYTVESARYGSIMTTSQPKLLQTLKDVHPFQITGLALSIFIPQMETKFSQNIKLASISAGNTVVVHTIPLIPLPKSSPPRYIVSGSTEGFFTPSVVITIIMTLVFAFFAQTALEIRGSSPTLFGLSNHIAQDVQGWLRVSHPIPNAIFGTPKPTISTTLSTATPISMPAHAESVDQSFASLLEALASQQAEQSSPDGKSPVIVIREHPLDPSAEGETNTELKSSIKADLHDEEVHGPHDGRMWEELSSEEKERWTKKLKDAGYWAEDNVEAVLKGVFWEVVGAAVPAA